MPPDKDAICRKVSHVQDSGHPCYRQNHKLLCWVIKPTSAVMFVCLDLNMVSGSRLVQFKRTMNTFDFIHTAKETTDMPSVRKGSHKRSKPRKRHSSVQHHHKRSNVHRGGTRKSSMPKRSRQKGGGETAKFWCMGCRKFSPSPIDRYEKGKNGMFAKGRCRNCDTKVSLIVKSEEPARVHR